MGTVRKNSYWLITAVLALLFIIAWGMQNVALLVFIGIVSSITAAVFFVLIFVNIGRKKKLGQTVGSWIATGFVAIISFVVSFAGGVSQVADKMEADKKNRDPINIKPVAFGQTVKTDGIEFTPLDIYRTGVIGSNQYNRERELRVSLWWLKFMLRTSATREKTSSEPTRLFTI